MKRIVTVVGARPQFVKAAVVSRALLRLAEVREVLVHTGQHYDANMSGVFFDELGIPAPAYDLAIGSASHGAQTARMLEEIERVLFTERPDMVLVYGDTNSTLSGALAAAKLGIPLAHIEAGLRSFNRSMPEEINRVLTDHLSDVLFAPTETAVANLAREGIAGSRVKQVGDVMFDASLFAAARGVDSAQLRRQLGLGSGPYALATIHRAENTDDSERLRRIIEALVEVSAHIPVVFPVHPRSRTAIERVGLGPIVHDTPRLETLDPLGYFEMQSLERGASVVITDSGGVQKEAYFHRVPCVTLREETEWVELVTAGWNVLAPPHSADRMVEAVLGALDRKRPPVGSWYGDGTAGERIVSELCAILRRASLSDSPTAAAPRRVASRPDPQ